jgi:threonine dehydratase
LSQKYESNLFLKCEHLQKTGSFKIRGALNKILSMSEEDKAKGIIAASTGNHGQGVALASKMTGVKATIYVPHDISPMKLEGILSLGADVKICKGDCLQSELEARNAANSKGVIFISPYNDPEIIAGQGTIGVELLKQFPNLDVVFVSVGGGGLVSGIASYLKYYKPDIKVIGCWPENSPVMSECIKAGEIFNVPEKNTISDGTAGGIEPGTITLPMCQELIDEHILVSEEEIKESIKIIASYERMIIEGAAAVPLAAFIKNSTNFKNQNIAVLLCGRNISLNKFIEAIQ